MIEYETIKEKCRKELKELNLDEKKEEILVKELSYFSELGSRLQFRTLG